MGRLAALLTRRLQKTQGVFISKNTKFHNDLVLPHPVGIVIGEGVEIGRNVKIFQNVTIGGARIGDSHKKNYPCIGDGTVIFAGAVIIGDIQIGTNCIIGANSVVTNSVPNGCTVVGAPARIIRKIDENE